MLGGDDEPEVEARHDVGPAVREHQVDLGRPRADALGLGQHGDCRRVVEFVEGGEIDDALFAAAGEVDQRIDGVAGILERVRRATGEQLHGDVERITAQGPMLAADVVSRGNDELTHLGNGINRLLARVRDDTAQQQVARFRHDALLLLLAQSQKTEALGRFTRGIAHDFNNALAAIGGWVRLADEDIDPGHASHEALQQALKSTRYASGLMQQLLTFSRQSPPKLASLQMGSLIEESRVLLSSGLLRQCHLAIDYPAQPVWVNADLTQMQQVLLNLCTNAWQAMPDLACGKLHIELRPHRGAPPQKHGVVSAPGTLTDWPEVNVCLAVSDNGAGMDAQTMERLFEPFFTTKPPGEGTGLGLAVVHGILRDHQAAIEVDSAPGRGSTFSLYFRAAGQLALSPEPVEALPRNRPAQVASGLVGTRILYVDDDEMINHLIERMLQRGGFQASVYRNPLQALSDVREGKAEYDLAIADFAMPGLSGLELARELRALHPDRPVAITSGYIGEDLRRLAPSVGIADLIPKPNTCEELFDAIERLASRVCRPPQP
mgnify:CR=1 FL=1